MKRDVNFSEIRQELESLAKNYFDYITLMPESIRGEKKPRTGLRFLMMEEGTDNRVLFSIDRPSERSDYYVVEKVVRARLREQVSSQNQARFNWWEFPGCLIVNLDGLKVSVSVAVSELESEEDVFVAVMALSYVFERSPAEICQHIRTNQGELPKQFQDGHYYLFRFLNSIDKLPVEVARPVTSVWFLNLMEAIAPGLKENADNN